MSAISLPPLLAAFFLAKNQHDVDALTACFSPSAVVHDLGEDRDLRGSEEIRAWLAETTGKYGMQVEVTSSESRDGAEIVGAVVTGDFPGSPYAFSYGFRLQNDRIDELTIDPIGPVE